LCQCNVIIVMDLDRHSNDCNDLVNVPAFFVRLLEFNIIFIYQLHRQRERKREEEREHDRGRWHVGMSE